MADNAETFDPRSLPTRSMRGGSQYMDVKFRLVWLRELHPDAHIATEQLAHDPGKWATFKASVSIPGGGSATGHGSETASDFGDYFEKAETKALGRALAALGFGTQFLPDDDEALADSPVDRPAARSAAPTPITERRPKGTVASLSQPITDRQVKFVWSIARDREMSAEDVHAETFRRWEKASVGDLTRAEASEIIEWLNGAKPDAKPQQAPATFKKIPPGQTTDEAPPPDENAWTTLWGELRKNGVKNGDVKAATDLIGTWNSTDPAGLLRQLRERVATMPEMSAAPTGSAGSDRWTR